MTLSHVGTLVTIGMTGVPNVCAFLAPKLTGDCDADHTKFAIGGFKVADYRERANSVAVVPRRVGRIRQEVPVGDGGGTTIGAGFRGTDGMISVLPPRLDFSW
jgi:hypothetical protein